MKTSALPQEIGICILFRGPHRTSERQTTPNSLIRSPEGNPISYVTAMVIRLLELFKSPGSRIETHQRSSPFPSFCLRLVDIFKALSIRRVFIEVRQTLAICLTFYPPRFAASSRDSRAEPADKVYVYNSSASLSRWLCKYLRFSAVSSRVQLDVYRIFLHLHAIRCLSSVLVFFVFRALEPSKRKTRQVMSLPSWFIHKVVWRGYDERRTFSDN